MAERRLTTEVRGRCCPADQGLGSALDPRSLHCQIAMTLVPQAQPGSPAAPVPTSDGPAEAVEDEVDGLPGLIVTVRPQVAVGVEGLHG